MVIQNKKTLVLYNISKEKYEVLNKSLFTVISEVDEPDTTQVVKNEAPLITTNKKSKKNNK